MQIKYKQIIFGTKIIKHIQHIFYQNIMKNVSYLECDRQGYHSGQFLNIVCLDSGCQKQMLCCCACIEQSHQGHQTKTLKKILMDADILLKNYSPHQNKNQVKAVDPVAYNSDIMENMVHNHEKQALSKFALLKKNLLKQIDNVEERLHDYYKNLAKKVSSQPFSSDNTDLKSLLAGNIQQVQGSSNANSLKVNLQKLLKTVNKIQKAKKSGGNNNQKPDQQSMLNFLKNSNKEVEQIVDKNILELYNKLHKNHEKLNKIIPHIDNFWQNQLFQFSPLLHHTNVQVINPIRMKATVDSVYQIAVMEPCLTFNNELESFRFKVDKLDLQWVGLGVCYKNIVKNNNFEFQFGNIGHGCYLVSGNAGTWSHSDMDYNNAVKSFKFRQGDSVTCIVKKDKICFIKDVPPHHQYSQQYSQRQYYELLIKPQVGDTLHPCVVSYYMNTQVQYIPSFSSHFSNQQMPQFLYKFSEKFKHKDAIVLNDNHIFGCQPTKYKCCLLDNPIEQNGPSNELKQITFRISRSTGTWIGLGVCHKTIIQQNGYDFYFEGTGHGMYMISANGGSWSHIDPQMNNIVRAFQFFEGDLVTVIVDPKNQKIRFKKKTQSYEMNYKSVPGDRLFPMVVLYFPDDEVEVLPVFR